MSFTITGESKYILYWLSLCCYSHFLTWQRCYGHSCGPTNSRWIWHAIWNQCFGHVRHLWKKHSNIDQILSTGHFYFTKLLLPILTSTAKASPDNKSRVVNISSLSHIFGGLDFNTFVDGPARRRQSPEQQYGQSKLVRAKVMNPRELFI